MAKGPIGERGRSDDVGEGRRYTFDPKDPTSRDPDGHHVGHDHEDQFDGVDSSEEPAGERADEKQASNPVADTFSTENIKAASAKVGEEAKRAADEFKKDFARTGFAGEDGETDEGLSDETRMWATLAHLGTFLIAFGVPPFLAPLIVYLAKKDDHPFIKSNALESLNFQISMMIWYAIGALLLFVFVGFVVLPALIVFGVVMVIVGSVRAWSGTMYRYPLSLRFVK